MLHGLLYLMNDHIPNVRKIAAEIKVLFAEHSQSL